MGFFKSVISGAENLIRDTIRNEVKINSGKTPGDDTLPGDVELREITLMSYDGSKTHNLTDQVVTIDIFESISVPFIFGEIQIKDSTGLIDNFPIQHEELIRIAFRTPGTKGKEAEYILAVNETLKKQYSDNDQCMTYIFRLVSVELPRNARIHVNKTYNDNIHNIVKDLISQQIGTKKPVRVDNTKGIIKRECTKATPMAWIDYFKRIATSPTHESGLFVFFESRDGFTFTTIERLMEEGTKALDQKVTDKEFFFDTARKDNIKDVTIRNIIAYNQYSRGGTAEFFYNGGGAQKMVVFDPLTGDAKSIDYKSSESFDKFKFADGRGSKPIHSPTYYAEQTRSSAKSTLMSLSSEESERKWAEKVLAGQAYLMSIVNNITHIYIYGDSELRVGDVIKCTFPSGVFSEQDKGTSKTERGNYMISSIHHMILNSDRPSHMIAVELMKGSLLKD